MRPRMLILFLALAPALLSCSGKVVPAVGESDDLVIVYDLGAAAARDAAVAAAETPSDWLVGEPAFRTTTVAAADLGDMRNRRHLLLVGVRGRDGVERLVRKAFRNIDRGNPRLMISYDGWARGQVVAAVLASSEDELVSYISRESEEIARALAQASLRRLTQSLEENSGAESLATDLMERYGWSLHVPPGYEIFNAAEDSGLVFFRRTRPDRTVSVYWGLGSEHLVSRDFVLAKKAELGRKYFDGDEVELRRPVSVDTLEFAGRPAVAVSGWWGNKVLVGGGPFKTFCTRDDETGIVYLVDVSLFAPGLEKMPLMRHLEGLASTFETRPPRQDRTPVGGE